MPLYPSISGSVIRGRGEARRMATPTLNLPLRCVPKTLTDGVYAAMTKTPIGMFPSVVYCGPRFYHPNSRVFEVHCFGLSEDLYKKRVIVELVKYLRPVKNFTTVEALKKQIAQDIKMAKKVLKIKLQQGSVV